NSGLRFGASTGKGRYDRRAVLRRFIWTGSPERGDARPAGRYYEHRYRLSPVCLLTADRLSYVVLAEDRTHSGKITAVASCARSQWRLVLASGPPAWPQASVCPTVRPLEIGYALLSRCGEARIKLDIL